MKGRDEKLEEQNVRKRIEGKNTKRNVAANSIEEKTEDIREGKRSLMVLVVHKKINGVNIFMQHETNRFIYDPVFSKSEVHFSIYRVLSVPAPTLRTISMLHLNCTVRRGVTPYSLVI
jgi:hypothetical protein